MKISLKPSSFILYGILFYILLYVISPFKYHIYSYESLLYLGLSFFLLYIGTKIGEHGNFNSKKKWIVRLNKKTELYLIVIMFISIFMAILYLLYVSSLKVDYTFATEDLRATLGDNRPTYTKFAEIIATAGIPCFFILSYMDHYAFKFTKITSYVAFFLPSIMILSIGVRGVAIVSIIIFFIHLFILKKRKYSLKLKITKLKEHLLRFVIIFIIFIFIIQIFINRPGEGNLSTFSIYTPNDIEYRTFHRKLNEKLDYKLDPYYRMFDYYTHSVPTFSYFYSKTIDSNIKNYPFSYQLYFFWTILKPLGLSSFNVFDVFYENPTTGRYSTFITGYIMDYGYFYALLMIFLTGLLLGYIWKNSQKGGLCFFIDSIILTMMFLAPIYYFWNVGSISAILFMYFVIIYFIRKGLILKNL